MKLILPVVFMLLTGCQTMIYGKASDLQKLSIGMNRNQVFEVMGNPYKTSANAQNNEEKLVFKKTWALLGWVEPYEVVLKDNKVISWGELKN